ncbi:MAG: hypothetical protein K6347_01180 [Campylobacterales bacterium]
MEALPRSLLIFLVAVALVSATPYSFSYRAVIHNGVAGQEELVFTPRLSPPEGTPTYLGRWCANEGESLETFQRTLGFRLLPLFMSRQTHVNALTNSTKTNLQDRIILLIEPLSLDAVFNGDCATISLYE